MERHADGEVLQLPSSEVICRRVVCAFAPESLKDLLEVKELVEASALNAFDWHLLRGEPFVARLSGGLFKPRNAILGEDVAGRIGP